MTRDRIRHMVLCAMFAALIAAGAFLRIPTPFVPITLQYLFTMLAGLLLGGKDGAAAVCLYVVLGLLGLPVFTAGGGPSYVFHPTFGYLIGFALGTFVTGTLAHRPGGPHTGRLIAASLAGLAIVYLCGTVYYALIMGLYLGTPMGLWHLFFYCVAMPAPGDILLSVLGAILCRRLIPILQRERT